MKKVPFTKSDIQDHILKHAKLRNFCDILEAKVKKDGHSQWFYQKYLLNLYKKYTYLKSKELEELPRFGVMSW